MLNKVQEKMLSGISSERQPPGDMLSTAPHGHWARKAARGAAALGMRQILTYGVNILGGIFLARLLTPSEFGFYAVISLFLAFLNIFGGTGLAGNLIRTPDEPTLPSYRAVFTAQQLLVGTICVGIWFAAPRISMLYHMHEHGLWFFRMIAVSLILTSLMVIPQVMMERHLAFDKLALIEVSQAISFNAVAIVLAWRGMGILAFAAGLIARSAVGAILANLISPWKAGFLWDPSALKSHVMFGLMLQSGQFFSMVKDSITPLFVGLFLGTTQMGYATWAMTFANYPAILLTPMQRLYLPFFARLQHDPAALSRSVSRALWIANVIAAPLTVLSISLAKPITSIVFGPKWLVALPVFYCFSMLNLSAPSNTPLMGLLNALGKPHLTLWVICLATIAIWLFGVPMVLHFGLFGFGLAAVAASLVNLLLYWMVWKETTVLPWRAFWPAWPLSIVIGVLVMAVQLVVPVHSIPVLFVYSAVALVIYCAILWFGFREQSETWIRLIRSAQ